jgi:hypothetical protein
MAPAICHSVLAASRPDRKGLEDICHVAHRPICSAGSIEGGEDLRHAAQLAVFLSTQRVWTLARMKTVSDVS